MLALTIFYIGNPPDLTEKNYSPQGNAVWRSKKNQNESFGPLDTQKNIGSSEKAVFGHFRPGSIFSGQICRESCKIQPTFVICMMYLKYNYHFFFQTA